MAEQVVVEELLVEIKLRADALEQGMAEVEARLLRNEALAKRTAKGLEGMGEAGAGAGQKTKRGADESSRGLTENKEKAGEVAAAHTAVGAAAGVAAFLKIVSAVQSGIEKANEYKAALNGLRNQADGVGVSFAQVRSQMDGLTDDALISDSDVAASIKNLLSYGFTIDQASAAIKRLKDSATYGRQANYSLGEAVRVTTEGIRMENSVLSDAAGVQKNLAKMMEDYAKALGKNKDTLTQAEKAQAVYNGLMEETGVVVGNAAAYADEFAGAQARLGKASLEAEQAIGGVAANALEPFYNLLTPIVQGITSFISQNESLVAGMGGASATFVGMLALISAYKAVVALATAANISLQSSFGFLGLVSLAVGAIAGLVTAASSAKSEMQQLTEATENVASYRRENAVLKENLAVLEDATATTEELAKAKKNLIDKYPSLISHFDVEGNAVLKGNEAIREKIALTQEQINQENELIRLTGASALARAEMELDSAIAARDEVSAAIERENQELEMLTVAWKEYDAEVGRVATRDGREFHGAGLEVALAEARENLSKYKEDYRKKAADVEEITSDAENVMRLRYQDEIGLLGELSEAQSQIAAQALSEALEQKMSQETFSQMLRARVADTALLVQAEQQLAAEQLEAAKSTSQWVDAEKSLKSVQDANSKAQTAAMVKKHADTVKVASKEVKSYTDANEEQKKALDALSAIYQKSPQEILNNADAISSLADVQYKAAEDIRAGMLAELQAFIDQAAAAGEEAAVAYPHVAALMALLSGATQAIEAEDKPKKRSGGGGGASAERKAAWEGELELMERVKGEMADLGDVYRLVLQDMLAQQRLSSTERARLEKELALALKAGNEGMGDVYIDYLRRILEEQQLNADQRQEIERKLVQAQKELYREQITELDELGNAVVEALRNRYAAEMEEQTASIDAQLAALREGNRAQQDAINRARDERVAALEQERDAKIKLIEGGRDAALKAIEKERDARVAAIEEQICALDDLKKARDRLRKDGEDEKQMARLKRQLAFEKDVRNQQILQEQILQLEKDIADRKEDERITDEKQRLQDELKEVKSTAADRTKEIKDNAAEQLAITRDTAKTMIEEARETAKRQLAILQESLKVEQEHLRAKQKGNEDYWKKRLSDEALMGEALVTLQEGTQDEIMELLQAYYPAYLQKGKQMGHMLYTGFDGKYKELLARTRSVADDIVRQAQRAISAWESMQSMTSGGGRSTGGFSAFSAGAVNVHQMFEAPIQAAIDRGIANVLQPGMEAMQAYRRDSGGQGALFAAGVSEGSRIAGRSSRTERPVELTIQFYDREKTPYETAKATEKMLKDYFER